MFIIVATDVILETRESTRGASDFSPGGSGAAFPGVGFNGHFVSFDPTATAEDSRKRSVHTLFIPGPSEVGYEKNMFPLANYDLSKISENRGERSVQMHHLDKLATEFEFSTTTGMSTAANLSNLGCPRGVATALSQPDGYKYHRGFVRYIVEVKHNISTPAEALRQAVASATNAAFSMLLNGDCSWDEVFVPVVGGNGYLIQFGVVALLYPCFPFLVITSKVLDLTHDAESSLAANYFRKIGEFIDSTNILQRPQSHSIPFGLSLTRYFEKPEIFLSKGNLNDSIFYLWKIFSHLFANEETRNYVVFPYCVRQDIHACSLIFPMMQGFRIGLPEEEELRVQFLCQTRAALTAFHRCGVVHCDFYLSNIMWKVDNSGGMVVKIIDWDAAHFVNDTSLSAAVDRILHRPSGQISRNDFATAYARSRSERHSLFHLDLSLFHVLERNVHNPNLRSVNKTLLDEEFRLLWTQLKEDLLAELFAPLAL